MAYIDETGLAEVTTKLKTYIDNKASGGGEVIEKDVNFYDYDGTLVASYSKAEFLALNEMPPLPYHTGLFSEDWNWDLIDAQTYVTDYTKLDIGSMFTTQSGLTEFDIELTKVTGLTINFAMIGDVNWGDGASETVSALTTHTYSDYGKYTITCDGTDIPSEIFGNLGEIYFCKNVRVGIDVINIDDQAFDVCVNLHSITMTPSIRTIGEQVFADSNLTSITIPSSVRSINNVVFGACNFLNRVIIPNSVTDITNPFEDCAGLTSITIPDSVTSIGDYIFKGCSNLTSITIPNTITEIPVSAFEGCIALESIKIPSTVSRIQDTAFSDCRSITLYDFSNHSSIPQLVNTDAFTGINALCKIVVPDSLYLQWITETNWITFEDYIYKASEVTL